MITGKVDNLEAIVELEILDTANRPYLVRTVIDTGYNGCLTIPPEVVSILSLHSIGQCRAMLADGNEVLLEEFVATILWNGQPRQIGVTQAEGGALLGMKLLKGCRLTIDAIEGGEVRIENFSSQV